jgi:cysteinyl-tRNA synthetase
VIRLFDTLRRKKLDFVPLDPDDVRMYVCGPTVYNFLHVGNGRPLVAFDVVYRHLKTRFPKVTYVRNITDVDDKIIKRAAELGEEPGALTTRFTAEFARDAKALGCLSPTAEPKVTENVPEIVALVARLIERGRAYVADGDVYFRVSAFPPYGQLSGQPLDQLEAGARVEVDERKKSPLDFALWKSAKPGEPSWPSPWGAGRPGWHIECSAMAEKLLGKDFDLHGGGVDLIFPHHENERAQSQGAHGDETFARFWIHNGFVNFNDKKIAKSDESMKRLLKSAFLLRVLDEKHGGEAVRFLLLTTHYRHPINFEVNESEDGLRFPGLEEAERQLEYGYLTRRRLAEALAVGPAPGEGPVAPEASGWIGELGEALDDDFNTAGAIAALQQGLGVANRLLDGKLAVAKDVKRRTLKRLASDLATASAELGLLEAEPTAWLAAHRTRRAAARKIDVAQVEAAIAERAGARAAKNFARSDEIREQMKLLGVELMDGPGGTSWRVAD